MLSDHWLTSTINVNLRWRFITRGTGESGDGTQGVMRRCRLAFD